MSRIEHILEKAEREGSVRRVRAIEGLPSLAAVEPVAAAPAGPAVALDTLLAATPETLTTSARIVGHTELDRRLIAAGTSNELAAEQYRALRTRMLHADNGTVVNVVLVTSPGRGEGKTLTAGNLGLTMAQEFQQRICVVDADMRHPQLHRIFGLPQNPGLAEVLTEQATLQDALVTIEEQQITILPSGFLPARPAELLGSTAMRRTLDALRSRFDRIVIDAPAAMPLADVGILTPLVDSVLLVVRAAITSKPSIHDAVTALDNSKLLGIVLNEAA